MIESGINEKTDNQTLESWIRAADLYSAWDDDRNSFPFKE